MRFSRILFPLALAPLALAAPEARPNPVAAPAPVATGGLLEELPEILSGVQGLLTTDNLNKLDTILDGAAKLLAADNIDILQDILNNAHSLLTKSFVGNTTTLIEDATPVCTALAAFGLCVILMHYSWLMIFPSFWVVYWDHCEGWIKGTNHDNHYSYLCFIAQLNAFLEGVYMYLHGNTMEPSNHVEQSCLSLTGIYRKKKKY